LNDMLALVTDSMCPEYDASLAVYMSCTLHCAVISANIALHYVPEVSEAQV